MSVGLGLSNVQNSNNANVTRVCLNGNSNGGIIHICIMEKVDYCKW